MTDMRAPATDLPIVLQDVSYRVRDTAILDRISLSFAPGAPTVLIGGLPAARVGDLCTCVGPPDAIVMGSAKVMIKGQPAARMGDQTAHGGVIVLGFPKVMIS